MTRGRLSDELGASVAQTVKGLETLSGASPREIRGRVLEAVALVAESDAPLYCGAATRVAGVRRFTAWHYRSDTKAEHLARAQQRWPELFQSRPNIASPSPIEVRAFVESELLGGGRDELERSELYQRVWQPHGIDDKIRLLAYHGRRFVGLAGALRSVGQPRFAAADRRRMAPLVRPVARALTAADTLERRALPDEPSYLWMKADGEVELSSAGGRAWLALPGLVDAVRSAVRALDQQKEETRSEVLERAAASIVRLDGDGSVRYLVTLRPLEPVVLSPLAVLSPAQREIAEFAAAGATVPEISKAVGRSAGTVHTHLRGIYQRLDVSSRVELARALEVLSHDQRAQSH
ncbi:LuxR C-terminal-related transcriptional regulator [Myxococcota bacterium]|nr:LuxR C-terminal-related transcriptional regulator [Myxococcota bacterium]